MPQLDILSDDYMETALRSREQAQAPMYRRALRANRDDLAGRGLLRGGVGAASTLDTRGRFQHDLQGYGNQIGMKQFEVAEQRKRAEDARAFQMALQKAAYDRQREQQARAEWIAEQRANQQFMASMFGSVGGMFGNAFGQFAGGQQNKGMGGAPAGGVGQGYDFGPPPDDAMGVPYLPDGY